MQGEWIKLERGKSKKVDSPKGKYLKIGVVF